MALEGLFDTLAAMSSWFRDNNAAAALQRGGVESWSSAPTFQEALEAATAVLAADDERGDRTGAVHQGQEVAWSDVDPLLELALYGRLVHQQQDHGGAGGGKSCPRCSAGDRFWCTQVTDPVTRRLGVIATELHAEVRRTVLADLGRATSG